VSGVRGWLESDVGDAVWGAAQGDVWQKKCRGDRRKKKEKEEKGVF